MNQIANENIFKTAWKDASFESNLSSVTQSIQKLSKVIGSEERHGTKANGKDRNKTLYQRKI